METGRTEAIDRHIERVVLVLNSYGVPAEYNEIFAADEDMYRIAMFKILPCPRNTQHDWSCCPYAHTNERARRRSLIVHTYHTKVCPDMQNTGKCPRGEACAMTHSMFEYWMHPKRYCTKLCREGTKCTRAFCFFAHTQEQLREGTDDPMGIQLLQAFLPFKKGLACVPAAACAASSGLPGSALPPLPGTQALQSVRNNNVAVSPQQLQQQYQGQQFVVVPAATPVYRPCLPGSSSACNPTHNSSPMASNSSSSCSSSSTMLIQPGHGMTLLGSSSGMTPVNSSGLCTLTTVPFQHPQQLMVSQQQQQQVPQRHVSPVQVQPHVYGQYKTADEALLTQLQQMQVGGHLMTSMNQPPAVLSPAAVNVMANHQPLQSTVLHVTTGHVHPSITSGLCPPGMQLLQTAPQQQQQQQQLGHQQQQLQLAYMPPATVCSGADYAANSMHSTMLPTAGHGSSAVSLEVMQSSQQPGNPHLSRCQGFDLVQQGSTDLQQLPIQAVQLDGMWLGT